MAFRQIPILRIFDEAKAREFYLDFLGMTVDWEHRFEPDTPIYMQVSRGDMVFHLSEHSGDGTPGTRVFVETDGLDALHAEISGKNYRYNRPDIETAPWNARIMCCIDPFSNVIQFNQSLD